MTITQQTRQFAEENLAACAADVLAWRRTGKLGPDAVLRTLGEMYQAAGFDDDLQQAEAIVAQAALTRVARAVHDEREKVDASSPPRDR